MYRINLDKGNRREIFHVPSSENYDGYLIEKLIEFEMKDLTRELNKKESEREEIQNMTLIDMFCRGSSIKEKYDINEKLIIMFLYDGAIY